MTDGAATTSKESPQESSVKRFFRKHNKSLTFAGAAIVFVTFIVKEDLKEYWKGTADVIDEVQRSYRSQSDKKDIQNDLYLFKRELLGDLAALANHGNIPDAGPAKIEEAGDRSASRLTDIRNYLSTFEPLIARFPKGDATGESFLKLTKSVGDLSARNNDLVGLYMKLGSTMDHDAAYERQVQEAWATSREMSTSVDRKWEESSDVGGAVLKEADLLRETNAKYATWAGWASTGLYAIGWSLALIGKLYGVDGVDVE
jgi:hypothetical protein